MLRKKEEQDLLRIGLFIIFDALVFHEVIAATQPGVNSLRLAPVSRINDFLKAEWEKIMRINYLPVFELANSVCQSLPTSPDTDGILKKLLEVALGTVSSGVLLKHDLMGRVYHRLLLKTTGKYYATYYTSVPAAWILSSLAIRTPNPDLDWNFENLKNIRKFKVLDPACGSGTLLSGVYMALKDKYILDRYNTDEPETLNLPGFHKVILEDVLHGWDVLDYAGHLTLTSLALHNPKATFTNSKIYIPPLGLIGNEIHLGSLDCLEHQPSFIARGLRVSPKRKGMVPSERDEVMYFPEYSSVDAVIMNPPFSRSAGAVNIKFGYEEKNVMTLMNKRLRELGKISGYQGIGQAGLGAYFIVMGDKLLKPGGRLAFVIPRGILSGVSWGKIRQEVFLKEYEIEYIVSNYDPGDRDSGIEPWNWSEHTDLGEVLIVARKTDKPDEERYVTFVNLWNKPKNELESLKIASDSIKARQKQRLKFLEGKGYEVMNLNKEVGVVYNLSQKYLKKNFLIPCLFAHPDLNKLAFDLVYKDLVPLIPLGTITNKLGVDRKQVEQNFKLVSHQTIYPILWGHPKSLNTIELASCQYAAPKTEGASSVYTRKGNLLVSGTSYLNNLSIMALYAPAPILSTVFWEVSLNEQTAQILTLWLNSTFGFLIVLGHSISSFGGWFNLKKGQLENLLVLDISELPNQDKQNLLNLFEEVKNTPFNSFSQEFLLASEGKGVRKQIDDEFIKILNLSINLKPYYEMLLKEPIISLERF